MNPQMLYVIRDTGTGYLKIGKAVDPEQRLKTLQTGCATPLELLNTFPDGDLLEGWLHKRCADFRVIGEWFIDCGFVRDEIHIVSMRLPAEVARRKNHRAKKRAERERKRSQKPEAKRLIHKLKAMRTEGIIRGNV